MTRTYRILKQRYQVHNGLYIALQPEQVGKRTYDEDEVRGILSLPHLTIALYIVEELDQQGNIIDQKSAHLWLERHAKE